MKNKTKQEFEPTIPQLVRQNCQYLVNSEKKFCKATQQKTCYKCRFFNPHIYIQKFE